MLKKKKNQENKTQPARRKNYYSSIISLCRNLNKNSSLHLTLEQKNIIPPSNN